MVYAKCRNVRCPQEGIAGAKGSVTRPLDVGVDDGGIFDQCLVCGSVDIDILSEEGLRHEQVPS